ncbi:hypothetical protein [Acinetobacter sp. ANC 4193]
MFTELIEAIISAFIANFKMKNHPYFNSFMQGVMVGSIGFIFGVIKFYSRDELNLKNIKFGLIISFSIGMILSLILMLLTYFERLEKNE